LCGKGGWDKPSPPLREETATVIDAGATGTGVTRPRVLLMASDCNPEWVSTPLVGWSLTRAIREQTAAHLVTQVRNREALLRAGLREGVDFTSIDSEAVARRAYQLSLKLRGGAGKGWTIGTAIGALTYPYFERLVWERFGRRIALGEFALVHRVTPMSPTVPSAIAAKVAGAGVPFVVGPLAGGVPWPKEFDAARRAEKAHLSYVRDAHRLLPHYRATRRAASAIFVASRDAYGQVPRDLRHKCFYLPENAIDPARFTRRRTRTAGRPVKCVFLGRLVPEVMDYGGLGELVTEKTGFLLPMGARQQIIERLRSLLTHLCEHPREIDAKSPSALRRAHEQFTWPAKARQVVQVYDWVLGRRPDRPVFPMPTPDVD
jgi:hypothetical protein